MPKKPIQKTVTGLARGGVAVVAGLATAAAVRIAPTLGIPHWEQPEETKAALDIFWEEMTQ